MNTCKYTESVEKWGTFEAEMPGKHEGNPFTDYAISEEKQKNSSLFT